MLAYKYIALHSVSAPESNAQSQLEQVNVHLAGWDQSSGTSTIEEHFSSPPFWCVRDLVNQSFYVVIRTNSDIAARVGDGYELARDNSEVNKTPDKVIVWKNPHSENLSGMTLDNFRELYFTSLTTRVAMTNPENKQPIPETALHLASCDTPEAYVSQLFSQATTGLELRALIKTKIAGLIQMEAINPDLFFGVVSSALKKARELNIENPEEYIANTQIPNTDANEDTYTTIKNTSAIYLGERSIDVMTLLDITPPIRAGFDAFTQIWYVYSGSPEDVTPFFCTRAHEGQPIEAAAPLTTGTLFNGVFYKVESLMTRDEAALMDLRCGDFYLNFENGKPMKIADTHRKNLGLRTAAAYYEAYLSENYTDNLFQEKINQVMNKRQAAFEVESINAFVSAIINVLETQGKDRAYIKTFLEQPVSTSTNTKQSLLSFMCANNAIAAITELQKAGVDFSTDQGLIQTDRSGQVSFRLSCLYIAAEAGHHMVIDALRAAGLDLSKDQGGSTYNALGQRVFQVSVLYIASQKNRPLVIAMLRAAGLDFSEDTGMICYGENMQKMEYASALYIASSMGHSVVLAQLRESVLDFSTDPGMIRYNNGQAYQRISGLYAMAKAGQVLAIKEWVAAGVDFSKDQGSAGICTFFSYPLTYLIHSALGVASSTEVVEILEENGAKLQWLEPHPLRTGLWRIPDTLRAITPSPFGILDYVVR